MLEALAFLNTVVQRQKGPKNKRTSSPISREKGTSQVYLGRYSRYYDTMVVRYLGRGQYHVSLVFGTTTRAVTLSGMWICSGWPIERYDVDCSYAQCLGGPLHPYTTPAI